MDYITIPPCEELKEFISHFWVLRQDGSEPVNPTYYLTANSLTELTFLFDNVPQNPELLFSSIQGQTEKSRQLPANPWVDIFGVSIFPYAVPYLFGIPADELNNLSIPMEELLGAKAEAISLKIALASTTEARINLLSEYLKTALTDKPIDDTRIIQAVHYIRMQDGNVNIKNLANNFCLSERQFERRFKTHAGFSPKLYARIVRFEAALNSHRHIDTLTETAYNNGYYDQAHFIREFRVFSGLSPSEYFSMPHS